MFSATRTVGLMLCMVCIIGLLITVIVPQFRSAPYRAPASVSTQSLDLKRYVSAGDRAYVVGLQNGSFPPMGWHIRGEMGGVWAPPIKLLDSYRFAINQTWLPPATRFTTALGVTRMEMQTTSGISVTRTEFAPDGVMSVLVGLTLHNPLPTTQPLTLSLFAQSEILATYPWDASQPRNASDWNRSDEQHYDPQTQTLHFQEPNRERHAVVGTNGAVIQGATGDSSVRQVLPDKLPPPAAQMGSISIGVIEQRVVLQGKGSTTIWFAIAGSHTSLEEAQTSLRAALADPSQLLQQKQRQRQALLERTQVELPDPLIQAAFDNGKLNLADLRRTVTNVQVRDVDEGRSFPGSVATLPELTGIAGGYPDYVSFFGTDGAYSTYPLVVSGQWDTAIKHLRAIRDVSRAINGASGKVIHEVTADGAVYFGANDDQGNTNETAQFAIAVELVWQWTGDNSFRDEMYAFVRDGLRTITTDLDDNANGCPEGLGMVERTGMAPEKLDVAVYNWGALRALERMAVGKGDTATQTWAKRIADTFQATFDSNWWTPSEQLYADSAHDCDQAGTLIQQRHWIIATPLELGLAPAAHATAALDRLETDTFTGAFGFYHTGVGGGADGRGELRTWTLPTSVMAIGEANYGRLGETQALRYMRAIAAQADHEMPGALPEIGASLEYPPLSDLNDRSMFMQAWSSYGIQWPVINHMLGIRPHIPQRRLSVVPQLPPTWPQLSVRNIHVGDNVVQASATHDKQHYSTVVTSPAEWKLTIGHVLPAGAVISEVRLDGKLATYAVVDTLRGRTVEVETTTSYRRTLVVQVK